MQRRAAAVYIAFFVVLAAGSYAFIATADGPSITVDDPEYQLENGSEIDAGERTYTVTAIEESESSGGHGGGGGVTLEATLSRTNNSAVFAETWEQNSTVSIESEDRHLFIPNATDPDEATLRTVPGNGSNANLTYDDQWYVVRESEDGTRTLTPYLQDEAFSNTTISEGDEIEFQGNATTVANITQETVLLEWQGERTESLTISDGEEFILNSTDTEGTEYIPHFRSSESFVLTTDVEGYHEQVEEQQHFHERINGVWGIVIISSIATVLLTGLAYLPRKE